MPLQNARRHYRAAGGQNISDFAPNTFPQFSVAQIANAIPKRATMGDGTTNPNPIVTKPMPLRLPMPQASANRSSNQLPQHKPPVPQYQSSTTSEPDNVAIAQVNPLPQHKPQIPQFTPSITSEPDNVPPPGGYYAGGRLKRASGGQNFSQYVANVPVGGSTGASNSPYVASIGTNGLPTGSVPQSNGGQFKSFTGAQSDVPNPNVQNTASSAAPSSTPTINGTAVGYYGLQNGSYTPLSTSQNGITYEDPESNLFSGTNGIGPAYSFSQAGEGNIPTPNITPQSTFYSDTGGVPGYVSGNQSSNPYTGQIYVEGSGGGYSQFAKGGKIPQFRAHRAAGGPPPSSEMAPWFTRAEARNQLHVGGLFGGSAAGRDDTLNRSVPTDSHVIPSDIVASIGKGNTLAGGNILTGMFHSQPYGLPASGGRGTPALRLPSVHAPAPQAGLPMPRLDNANGGRHTDHGAQTVPIAASSGEFLIHPAGVYQKGLEAAKNMKLDPKKLTPRKIMDLGHDVVDAFILHQRKKEIKTLSRLPPPARD